VSENGRVSPGGSEQSVEQWAAERERRGERKSQVRSTTIRFKAELQNPPLNSGSANGLKWVNHEINKHKARTSL